jgi:hypothetical protein
MSVESFDNFGLKTTFINVFALLLKVKQIFQMALNTGPLRNKRNAGMNFQRFVFRCY